MEIANHTVNPEEIVAEEAENADRGDFDEGKENDVAVEPVEDGEALGDDSNISDEVDYDEETELTELRRISGIEFGSLSEFSGYQRYLELKKSGILTSEEAFYAVNRGENAKLVSHGGLNYAEKSFNANGSKGHMTATRRKPSSGEVFTRADREELAKWGISATGSELERLWREAGR